MVRSNIAPMGPRGGSQHEYVTTAALQYFRDLSQSGQHGPRCVSRPLTNSLLLATAALGRPEPYPELKKLDKFDGYLIADACRWYSFEVIELDDSQQRVEITCRTVASGDLRPFLGWNRATHSVLEAAILATRVGILPDDDIQRQLDALRVIVDKTASDRERVAFRYIENFVNEHVNRTR